MYRIVMVFGICVTLLSAARLAWATTNTDEFCLAFCTYAISNEGGILEISDEWTLHCATHTCSELCTQIYEGNGNESREFCECPGGGSSQCTVEMTWNATGVFGAHCQGSACCTPKRCKFKLTKTVTQHPGYKVWSFVDECKCE